MNAEKLKKMVTFVRIGGKGTARRKKKTVHRVSGAADDKKLQNAFKKLNCHTVPGIEEVNMLKDDGSVIIVDDPKEVQFVVGSNMFIIRGKGEEKPLDEILPRFLQQMWREPLRALKQMGSAGAAGDRREVKSGGEPTKEDGEGDDDEIPELVEDFDKVAITE